MQFAEVTDGLAVDQDVTASAGMKEGFDMIGGNAEAFNTQSGQKLFQSAFHVIKILHGLFTVPASAEFAADQCREHRFFFGQFFIGGGIITAGQLKNGKIQVAAAHISRGNADHAGKHHRTDNTLFIAEGIHDLHAVAAHIVFGQKKLIVMFLIHETVGHQFIEAHGNHDVPHFIGDLLSLVFLPFGHLTAGERGGDLIVTVQTGHFLDEIHLPFDIHTVMGYGNAETAFNGFVFESKAVHHRDHGFIGDFHTDGGAGVIEDEIDFRFFKGTFVRIDGAFHQRTAGQFAKELTDAVRCAFRRLHVDALFKTGGRFGRKTQLTRGQTDGFRIEISAFDQDVFRIFCNFGILTAHDAGNADGFFTVADQKHIGGKIAFLIIEGHDFFTFFGPANNDLMPTDGVIVEGMGRLIHFQHDIVGNINDIADGADPCGGQTMAHPHRRRTDLNVFHHFRGVTGAEVFIFYFYFGKVMDIPFGLGQCDLGQSQGFAADGGHFSRHIDHGKTVGAVGRQLKFKDRVVQIKSGNDVFPYGKVIGKNEDAAFAFGGGQSFGNLQFRHGAEHPFGSHTGLICRVNMKTAGKIGADERQRHLDADTDIGGAADDGQIFAFTGIHFADMPFGMFGIRMIFHGFNLGNNNIFNTFIEIFDPFHAETDKGQTVGQLFGTPVHGNKGFQPLIGYIHLSKASSKFAQETNVVIIENTKVVNTVFQHGNAFHTQTEGKAPELSAVVARHFKNIGMHHAGAENFDPTGITAGTAAFAAANAAGNIHFGAGFGKREITGTEADLTVFAEELTHHFEQRPFQVGHGDIFVDDKPFHLVEHGRMGGVVVSAEYAAGANDFHGVFRHFRRHRSYLHRRSMSTEQRIFGNIERVLHITGGMILRQVQAFKVIIIIFHFGAFADFIAHTEKDLFDFFNHTADGMDMAGFDFGTGQRNIDFFRFDPGFQRRFFQFFGFHRKDFFQSLTDFIGHLTDFGTVFAAEFAHAFENRRQFPFFAEVLHAQVI